MGWEMSGVLFLFVSVTFFVLFFSFYNYLMVLLFIELIGFMFFMYFSLVNLGVYMNMEQLIFFVCMMVVEGVMGLCLLMSEHRSFGAMFYLMW